MLHETAMITAIDDGWLTLNVERKGGCAGCKTGCGVSKLAAVGGGAQDLQLRLPDPGHLQVGQRVIVGLPEPVLLQATLLTYGLPLLLFFVAIGLLALVVDLQTLAEGWQLLAGVAGGFCGWWLARIFSRRLERQARVQPQLLGPAPDTGSAGHC